MDTPDDAVIERKPVRIVVESAVSSIAFLAGEPRIVSGERNGRSRCWRVEDGEEVGTPVNKTVRSLAVSQDGRWIVIGTRSGQVMVWDAKSGQKVSKFSAHETGVNAVDISPDGTKLVTADNDMTAAVWSLRDGKRLLSWEDDCDFHTFKFSPDSSLVVLGSGVGDESDDPVALDIYNIHSGRSQFVGSKIDTKSFAWANDSKQLFTLSIDGNIRCLDVDSGATLAQWPIHSTDKPTCISLSRNGAFIAASANSSVSFWDTFTHEQIGFVIHHPVPINCMAVSEDSDFAIAGSSNIVLWDLRNVLPTPYIDDQRPPEDHLERTQTHLKETIAEFRVQLIVGQHRAKQKEDALENTIKALREELAVQNTNFANLEKTVEALRIELANSQESTHRMLRAHRQRHQCETLFADGHVIDSAKCLLNLTKSITNDVIADTVIMDWLSDFTAKCITTLETLGDEESKSKNHEDARATYAVALSLAPSCPNMLLNKWASIMLLRVSTKEILDATNEFGLPRFVVYRTICDVLERDGRVTETIECFRQLQNELTRDTNVESEERTQWELDFQRRCTTRLEKLAESAMGSQNFSRANEYYSTMLSLNPPDSVDVLIKRSKARAMMKSWEDALKDASEAIKSNPSSHLGYEQKHAALHGAKQYAEAVVAFNNLLLNVQKSSDLRIHGEIFRALPVMLADQGTIELRSRYTDARSTIWRVIHATISHMPRVLIDTSTGRLVDKMQQAKAFEELPIFSQLVSSMTRAVDQAWIRREVEEFYQYVMFSHRWEDGEPLFRKVERDTVYKLEASRANTKLRTFCSIVRSLGLRWAWSDTCCIDKENNVILQESLVAMFAWYRGSSLTIVHLLGISSTSEGPDDILNSIWNSRVWTHQEYVAAKRVKFYTEDWKPYLGLTLANHKDSPIVLRQMEVSQVSAEQVAVLQPGLDRVREKLYLASTRETTLVEDIAYSLLGIFHAPIPVIYGEGTRSVGRLLEYVLTGSGDATILAWTGAPNEYNTCLPLNLTVYNPLVPPHIPHMETTAVDEAVTNLCSSLPDVDFAMLLYDRLNALPPAIIASSRLRLPGIVFAVTDIGHLSGPDPETNLGSYHATATFLGDIEITTTSNLNTENEYSLVHPWIRPLLDQEYARGTTGLDKTTCALRLIARLKQQFGALLFEKVSRVDYKRVAADSLIMVQIRDDVPLTDLINHIETIEVQ